MLDVFFDIVFSFSEFSNYFVATRLWCLCVNHIYCNFSAMRFFESATALTIQRIKRVSAGITAGALAQALWQTPQRKHYDRNNNPYYIIAQFSRRYRFFSDRVIAV